MLEGRPMGKMGRISDYICMLFINFDMALLTIFEEWEDSAEHIFITFGHNILCTYM